MVEDFGKLGRLMISKLYILNAHLNKFLQNLGDFSKEQGACFQQVSKEGGMTIYDGRFLLDAKANYPEKK